MKELGAVPCQAVMMESRTTMGGLVWHPLCAQGRRGGRAAFTENVENSWGGDGSRGYRAGRARPGPRRARRQAESRGPRPGIYALDRSPSAPSRPSPYA